MEENQEKTKYVPLSERIGQPMPQQTGQIEPLEQPQFPQAAQPSTKEYVPLSERMSVPSASGDFEYEPIEPQEPSFGELFERGVITVAEAFNSPFKLVGRSIWNVGQALGDPDEETQMPKFLADQRAKLQPAETMAERAIDVGGEVAGATLSMLLPVNAGAQLYAKTAGMSRIATTASTATKAPFERGVPHRSLIDKQVNKQRASYLTRQEARKKTAEEAGKEPGRVRRLGQKVEDLPYFASEAAQAVAQAPQAITRSYIDDPIQNFTIEAVSAVGAGAGAGLMEAFLPGNITAQSYGALAGGFSPAALAVRGVAGGGNAFKNVIKSFSSEERHKIKLAKVLTEAAEKNLVEKGLEPTPENIQSWRTETIERLSNMDESQFDLSAGMQTGDDVILGFESSLANMSMEYKGYRTAQLEQAFNELDTFIAGMFRSGNVNDIKFASELRYAADKDRIGQSLAAAQRHASEMIAKLDFTPEGKAEASRKVSKIINDVYKKVDIAENKAWALVKGDQDPFSADQNPFANIFRAVNDVSGRVTRRNPLPFKADLQDMRKAQNYRQEIRKIESDGELSVEEKQSLISELNKQTPKNIRNYKVKNLINVRRDMLEEVRQLKEKGGTRTQIAILGELAESIRLDLDRLAETFGDVAYQRATAFSKAKSDVFQETFAGRVVAKDSRNNPKINPEIVLYDAFGPVGSTRPQRRLRLEELEAAADFDPAARMEPIDGEVETFGFKPEYLGGQVISEESAFLRASLSQLVDANGNVSRNRLNNFLSDAENQKILNRPEMRSLRDDLENIETAQVRVKAAQEQYDADIIEIENSAFANMVGDVHPAKAIRTIMASDGETISKKIKDLADEARSYDTKKSSGKAARNGLLRSLIDYAFSRSGAEFTEVGERIGTMSFSLLKARLENPVSSNAPSIKQLALRNRLMTEAQWKNYMEMVDLGANLEAQAANPAALESLAGEINAGTDLMIRLLGANLGSRMSNVIPGRTGGGGIVEASAGVRSTRAVFEKTPLKKLQEFKIKVAKNPEMLKDVLMVEYTPKNRADIRARINAFMIQSGILSASEAKEILMPGGEAENADTFVEPDNQNDTSSAFQNQNLFDYLGLQEPVQKGGKERYVVNNLDTEQKETVNQYRPLWNSLEKQYELPENWLEVVAFIESSYDPQAIGKTNQNARGLFQFTPIALEDYPHDPFDPKQNSEAAARYASRNMQALQEGLGRKPSAFELYLAHQQGSSGALRLLTASPNELAAKVRNRSAIMGQNLDPETTTVNEFINKFKNRYNSYARGIS